LIHNRLSKLEEGQLMVKRNRVIHSFLAENNPTALKNYLEWEATKHEAGQEHPLLGPKLPSRIKDGKEKKGGPYPKNGKSWQHGKIDAWVQQFNRYWYEITGREINFTFGVQHHKFLTFSEQALGRNQTISKYFLSRPVILEPFAGCGSDTISFLYNLQPEVVIASDMTKKFEFDYIKENLHKFRAAYPEVAHIPVLLYNERSSVLLSRIKQEPGEGHIVIRHIDLLYLDPPWTLPGMDREATPDELLDFMMDEVFIPMRVNKFVPKMIVIKTRFGMMDMDKLMTKIHGFELREVIIMHPLSQDIHFHIITSTEVTITRQVEGETYKNVFRNGPESTLPPGDPQRMLEYSKYDFESAEKRIEYI
jgi:hypothetical protein